MRKYYNWLLSTHPYIGDGTVEGITVPTDFVSHEKYALMVEGLAPLENADTNTPIQFYWDGDYILYAATGAENQLFAVPNRRSECTKLEYEHKALSDMLKDHPNYDTNVSNVLFAMWQKAKWYEEDRILVTPEDFKKDYEDRQ